MIFTILSTIAAYGLAFETYLAQLLPFDYAPYYRFFTSSDIVPQTGIHHMEAFLFLATLMTVFLRVVCLRRWNVSWAKITPRALSLFVRGWGMLVSVSFVDGYGDIRYIKAINGISVCPSGIPTVKRVFGKWIRQ
jgi:hypothetical protein